MRQMNCTPFILSCLALASLLPYAEAANAGNSAQEQELMVTEPRPFVCDVRTGYLLQYSFVSPRPYCWRNASVDALITSLRLAFAPESVIRLAQITPADTCRSPCRPRTEFAGRTRRRSP